MLGSFPDDLLPDLYGAAVKPDASATARTLLALEAVQNSPGITADRLAGALGVSERAARRYVAILREAGIPIESVRGRYGGYRLGRGVLLPPLMFSAAEAVGLIMAVLDGHHDTTDTAGSVGSAFGKIVRALPAPVAAQVDAVRRTTAPAPDRAAARPDPTTAITLVQACSDRRRVRLHYRPEISDEWVAEVDPWAVVVRHGRWYLLCWSHVVNAQRAYRIDRVRAVETLDDTFSPPSDIEPVAALEEHLAVGWEYDVEVVIDAPIDVAGQRLPRALGRLEAVDAQTTRLVGSTSNPQWHAAQLTVIPMPFRIVRCPEIQEAAHSLGQRLLAAAGSPSDS